MEERAGRGPGLRIRPSTTRSTPVLRAKSLLNAALFFAVFMVALPWGAHRLLPWALPLPQFMRVWGAGALFSFGIAVWAWSLELFSRRGRGTPLPFDAPRLLVTTGAFGVVRNPIMLAELCVIGSIALHFASGGIALYALAMCLLAHLSVVYVEEPELRERFGAEYDAYCRRVPRWLPRPRSRKAGM